MICILQWPWICSPKSSSIHLPLLTERFHIRYNKTAPQIDEVGVAKNIPMHLHARSSQSHLFQSVLIEISNILFSLLVNGLDFRKSNAEMHQWSQSKAR